MIESGAAGVHFEDQLAAEKKCGHLGGKVLVPTSQFIRTLVAARLAADVLDVPTVLVARTDALSASLLTSDIDPVDARVRHRRADARGLLPRPGRARAGDRAVARLCAVRRPALVRDLDARHRRGPRVRGGDPRRVPRQAARLQLLAVVQLEARSSMTTRSRASARLSPSSGYRFQFITLAGFHSLNASMFELARGFSADGMTAYVELQEREFALEARRLHGDEAPARGRRRILRPRGARSSAAASPRRWRYAARPRPSNSKRRDAAAGARRSRRRPGDLRRRRSTSSGASSAS